jgi:hypothetical protein
MAERPESDPPLGVALGVSLQAEKDPADATSIKSAAAGKVPRRTIPRLHRGP